MQLRKFIQSDKFFVLADQVVVSGTAFATNLLLARALGLQAFGIFSIVGLIQFFCLSISIGITTQVYQVVFPAIAANQQKIYTSGLFYIQCLLLLFLLVAGVIFYYCMPLNWHQYKPLVTTGCLATCLFLLQDFIRKVLLTKQLYKKTFLVDFITNFLQLIILFLAWQNGYLSMQNAWLIVGLTFIPSIAIGLLWIQLSKPSFASIKFAWTLQKNKTGWLLMSNMLQWCTGYFFVIAAGWWVGAAALGALRLAQYIFGLLNVLLQAIENYALPKAAALKENQSAFLMALLKKMMLLMLPILLLLSLFSKQIFLLAGGEAYASYNYVVYGLSAVYFIITIGYPVRIAIRSQHLNKQYFTGYILAMIFSLSSAYWLLKNWQLMGVLTGLFIIQCITIGYWLLVLQQRKILTWKSFTWS